VWDLFSGTEIGRLRGHTGTVKCVQVEDHVCLTGGADGNVRLWDLRRVDADQADGWGDEGELVTLSDVAEEEEEEGVSGDLPEAAPDANGVRSGKERATERDDCCARVLEGHTKAVTALYFEDECLVSVLPSGIFYWLTPIRLLGPWRVRQDASPVGLEDRPMRDDHGHPMGDISPAEEPWRHPAEQHVLGRCRVGRDVCGPDSPVCGWQLGHVRRLCWRCTVLGVRTRQRQRRRCRPHVGQ
jgi:WD40 repeat protein